VASLVLFLNSRKRYLDATLDQVGRQARRCPGVLIDLNFESCKTLLRCSLGRVAFEAWDANGLSRHVRASALISDTYHSMLPLPLESD
jgi:hypothetical protein